MNLLRLLIPSFLFPGARSRELSDSAVPPAANPNRVHLFVGDFASEIEATDYCLRPMERNKPEPLTRDLPDAMINTAEVEILFGSERIKNAMPMFEPIPAPGGGNTLIMIAEAAFGGLPYTLNDTPNLRYIGAFEVS